MLKTQLTCCKLESNSLQFFDSTHSGSFWAMCHHPSDCPPGHHLDSKICSSCSESQYEDLSDEVEKGLSNLNFVFNDKKITQEKPHIMHTLDRLATAIPNPPVLAVRRPRNLRDNCPSRDSPSDTSFSIQFGTCKCRSKCVVCKTHVWETDSFIGNSSGTTHKTYGYITFWTSNIIYLYLISYQVCNVKYVGETKNTQKNPSTVIVSYFALWVLPKDMFMVTQWPKLCGAFLCLGVGNSAEVAVCLA